jgi:very-short-patch-repair endonuclease
LQGLDRDRALVVLASEQHAVVARRQLVAVGFGRHAITQLIDRGRLHLVHRGVYAVGQPRLTRNGRWMAATLAAGPGAALSHRSAGALHRVCAERGTMCDVSRPVACRQRPGLRIHHAPLPADEVDKIDGIPVTTVARTLLDLAADLPRPQLERAMNEADIRRLGDCTPLSALIDRYPRRAGTATLRAILASKYPTGAPTRNDFEAFFLDFLRDHDLPRPFVNHQVPAAGECDFVWPQHRLIVEVDGYETHGTRQSFEADRARDRALQVAGWRVVRVTWRELLEQPAQLARGLRALLAAAQAA